MTVDTTKGGNKVLVAMSGGVDSTVAVKLLKESGCEVAGATMRLLPDADRQIERAEKAARRLGIEFYVFDLEKEFRETVKKYFCESYENGRTPNPCVVCNKKIKFGLFLEKATALGFDHIATGHYARIKETGDGRLSLAKAASLQKDQSYFLFGLTQEIMSKVLFPLGDIDSKENVRELARLSGLENAEERDSQDICFVPGGNYIGFIEDWYAATGKERRPGNFIDINGNILGTHGGMERFTIGQRKGVGMTLGEEPVYVISKRASDGAVIMGADELLYTDTLTVVDPNFPRLKKGEAPPEEKHGLQIKTRSGQKTVPGSMKFDRETGTVIAHFDRPLRAAAPGQFAVFYDGDEVFCGGEIR